MVQSGVYDALRILLANPNVTFIVPDVRGLVATERLSESSRCSVSKDVQS